jgi:hypothetical protein
MEWFFSTHLGVMAANKLSFPADFWLNSIMISLPTIIKTAPVMTNMVCRELLAHLHIPLGRQTEEMVYGMVLQHSLGCHGC